MEHYKMWDKILTWRTVTCMLLLSYSPCLADYKDAVEARENQVGLSGPSPLLSLQGQAVLMRYLPIRDSILLYHAQCWNGQEQEPAEKMGSTAANERTTVNMVPISLSLIGSPRRAILDVASGSFVLRNPSLLLKHGTRLSF